MLIQVDRELFTICERILKEGRSLEKWRELESDDMFQTANYSGGFDSTEDAFCFSYNERGGGELWFQLTTSQIAEVVAGELKVIEARMAEV